MTIVIKKQVLCLIMAVVASFVLIACGADTEPEEIKKQSANDQISMKNTEPKAGSTTELASKILGDYTLEECLASSGVFIGYEDGSFDMYPAGGYCYGLSSRGGMFYGMFMHDNYAEMTKPVKAETKLLVFADGNYSLTLHPIHSEVSAFSTNEGGTLGYGKISQITDKAVPITVFYKNKETESIYPLYINGEKATAYDAKYIKWSVTPFKGMPSTEYTYQLWGFQKNTNVTLGIGEGTALVEKTYSVDSTYYDCDYEHNNWQDDDIYYIDGIPTPKGYAEVDLSGVTNGRYVMVYATENTYMAMLLILDK